MPIDSGKLRVKQGQMSDEYLDILNRVKTGAISAEEGARLLETLEMGSLKAPVAVDQPVGATIPAPVEGSAPEVEPVKDPAPVEDDFRPEIGWWKHAWMVPFWVGTVIVILSAVFMGWANNNSRMFWFYCSWLPLLLGIFVVFLGWWSQTARWVHVRVHDSNGHNVSVSVPLPLRLASWALRVFGPYIPKLREKHLDNLPMIFDALGQSEGPLSVEVDDENGDRVRVYIL